LGKDLQLKHLQYLVALAKQRHFGRAANALQISQSALSQAIQHLEKHFSTPIVCGTKVDFRGSREKARRFSVGRANRLRITTGC
jgi:hypothetical protein